MLPGDYIISQLATLMWNEGTEDGLPGMTACGLVVRNRVMKGWHGGQWLQVIQHHDDYSAEKDKAPRVLKFGDPLHDNIFRRCLGIAESIHMGRERDITADHEGNGSLWYGRLDTCSDWFRNNIVRAPQEHPRVATIGLKSYFR